MVLEQWIPAYLSLVLHSFPFLAATETKLEIMQMHYTAMVLPDKQWTHDVKLMSAQELEGTFVLTKKILNNFLR